MVTLDAEVYRLKGGGSTLNDDAVTPFVDITRVDGLDNAPIRSQVANRESLDGGWVDARFENPRVVTLEGNVYADNDALETYLDELKENWAPSTVDLPLYFGTDAGTRVVFGKPHGARYNKDQSRRLGIVPIQFQIVCGDPTIYDEPEIVDTLPGTTTIDGNRDSYPVIVINNSRTNPSITLGGKTMTITDTISAGSIEIDVRNRTIFHSNGTNKRNKLSFSGSATWDDFALSPGANVFTVGGTGSGVIDITVRSAWR